MSVEVSTARAVCVGSCVRLEARVLGVSQRVLQGGRQPDWRVAGALALRPGLLCGLAEGTAAVRARVAGVWSAEREVIWYT